MELINQACSLELAKKLEELEVKQESLFYWYETDTGWILTNGKFPTTGKWLSAFSVAELGELLPKGVHTWKYLDESDGIKWAGKIPLEENTFGAYNNEADARAKILIYLLENKFI